MNENDRRKFGQLLDELAAAIAEIEQRLELLRGQLERLDKQSKECNSE